MDGFRVLELPKKKKYHIRPRHGWVLVRKITQDVEKVGDVFIDKSQRQSLVGEVMEVSEKVTDLKAGDRVIISAFTMEIPELEELTGQKDLVMLRDEEIYSRCDPDED